MHIRLFLGRLLGVNLGMLRMPMGDVRVMTRLRMLPRSMMLRRFLVMHCGVLMMHGGFLVMLGYRIGHMMTPDVSIGVRISPKEKLFG
ncbi:MAG: hypothetical protein AB7T14_08350 [Candidatus Methylacidiphilaceae bacterium]